MGLLDTPYNLAKQEWDERKLTALAVAFRIFVQLWFAHTPRLGDDAELKEQTGSDGAFPEPSW
jgi:hypothetical protein